MKGLKIEVRQGISYVVISSWNMNCSKRNTEADCSFE